MIERLTPREREALKFYAELGNAKEVASALNINSRTVQYHLENARIKLSVDSTQQAIALTFNHLEITPKNIRSCCLTKREAEILELIKLFKKDIEIAQQLTVSPRTIESQISSILRKSGLKNRQQLDTYSRLYPEKFIHRKQPKETLRDKIISLRAQGFKVRAIAQQLKTTVRYVYNCK